MVRALACALFPLGGVLAAADDLANVSRLIEGVNGSLFGNLSNDLGLSTEEAMDFGVAAPGGEEEDMDSDPGMMLLPLVSAGGSPTSVAADEKGVRAMFGDAAVNGACHRVCSGETGRFSVNGGSAHRGYITQGAIQWSAATRRSYGSRQVSRQTVTNHAPFDVTQEVRLVSSVASSVAMSTTNTISIGREFAVEVSIPEVAKVTSKSSFTFSTSKTKTLTDTKTSGGWNTVRAPVPANSSVCISLEVDHETYEADFSVPICYTGYFKCNYGAWWFGHWFGRRCNGHYNWYAKFSYIFGSRASCKTLRGRVAGNRYTHAHGRVSLGACPRQLSAGDTDDAASSSSDPLVQAPPIVV